MYSSIIKKMCKCGCGKFPTTGYAGYSSQCRPDLVEKKMKEQKERQKKANAVVKDTRGLKKLAVSNDYVREKQKEHLTKSQLLQQADKVFGDWIKNRDTINGKITCVCCKNVYSPDAETDLGDKIINVMHFIERGVYSLRFDEDNCHAGCCYCNLSMHLNKNGRSWKQYRDFMIFSFGQMAVDEMELASRKINKLESTQLKNIIEHYSTT